MQPCKKPYGLLSIFAFILSGASYLFYLIANQAGNLIIHGGNNISNIHDYLDREEVTEIFVLYLEYIKEFRGTFFDWTIGIHHLKPLALAIILAVLGVVLAIACFRQKQKD